MQASANVIETESKPSVEFNPEKIINKYIEKAKVETNPVYNGLSLAIDAANGKRPKREEVQDLFKNTREFIEERREKVRENPRLWAYNTLRSGFFFASGVTAANQNELDLFSAFAPKSGEDNDTAEEKAEKQKKTVMEYTNLLMNYEKMYDLE